MLEELGRASQRQELTSQNRARDDMKGLERLDLDAMVKQEPAARWTWKAMSSENDLCSHTDNPAERGFAIMLILN